MPALALAVVVILGASALVIDRLSLDVAKHELRNAAEAAALAAARELACDDRLRSDFDPAALKMKACFAAARIANENIVAGQPLFLDTSTNRDVRFGRLTTDPESGEKLFEEVDGRDEPMTVAVNARRTTDRDSAVPLPFRTLYAVTDADVVAIAEASLDFHVRGLRPSDQSPIPTLPLAILAQTLPGQDSSPETSSATDGSQQQLGQPSPSGQPTASSWMRDVEQRNGLDRFGYDASTGTVTQAADGIPEITLRTASRSGDPTSNAFVLNLVGDLTMDQLRRHVSEGWSADDLQPLGGELLFDGGSLMLAGMRGVDSNALATPLRTVLGQSRVVFLYDREVGDARASAASLHISGMVAGRVMSVREISSSECEIVFQPSVMATRSAVTAANGSEAVTQKNKYVANLRLTN